jgi:hypothetical protein
MADPASHRPLVAPLHQAFQGVELRQAELVVHLRRSQVTVLGPVDRQAADVTLKLCVAEVGIAQRPGARGNRWAVS